MCHDRVNRGRQDALHSLQLHRQEGRPRARRERALRSVRVRGRRRGGEGADENDNDDDDVAGDGADGGQVPELRPDLRHGKQDPRAAADISGIPDQV